ncbi:uncharacterized protein LOC143229953 [Tachypleus tridentatus]|uniref:uncharacterized protein LOC143229953 n=1 Tax=Tachypleus tridentatus TaxID=6853 RepID=UPI003FCF133B
MSCKDIAAMPWFREHYIQTPASDTMFTTPVESIQQVDPNPSGQADCPKGATPRLPVYKNSRPKWYVLGLDPSTTRILSSPSRVTMHSKHVDECLDLRGGKLKEQNLPWEIHSPRTGINTEVF